MPLKDCLKKLRDGGYSILERDKQVLQQYLDDGLTEDQAVTKLVTSARYEVLKIVREAEARGALVRSPRDTIGNIAEIGKKRLERLRAERRELAPQIEALNNEYDTIEMIRTTVARWPGAEGIIDINDDVQLMQRASAMFFAQPDLYKNGYFAEGMLKANTPQKLYERIKALADRRTAVREQLGRLNMRDAELIEQMQELGAQVRRKDTFYQSVAPGFKSAVVVAAQNIKQKKGDSKQFLAQIKKQPGVTDEEIEFLALDEWAEITGKTTKDELLAYLNQNEMVIQDIVLGFPGNVDQEVLVEDSYKIDDFEDLPTWAIDEGIIDERDFYSNPDVYYPILFEVKGEGEFLAIIDLDVGDAAIYEESSGLDPYTEDLNEIEFANVEVEEFLKDVIRNRRQKSSSVGVDATAFDGYPEYGTWSLEGGTNYREHLLALPSVHDASGLDYNSLLQMVEAEFSRNVDPKARKIINRAAIEFLGYEPTYGAPFDEMVRLGYATPKWLDSIDLGDASYLGSLQKILRDLNKREQFAGPGLNYDFQVDHFSEFDNVIGWARTSDRVTDSGTALLIDEFQSDIHQDGRKYGYESRESEGQRRVRRARKREAFRRWLREGDNNERIMDISSRFDAAINSKSSRSLIYDVALDYRGDATKSPLSNLRNRMRQVYSVDITKILKVDDLRVLNEYWSAIQASEAPDTGEGTIPRAPFRNNAWVGLTLKRMIRRAVDEGKSEILISTGDIQNKRYKKAIPIRQIRATRDPDGLTGGQVRGVLYDTLSDTGTLPDDAVAIVLKRKDGGDIEIVAVDGVIQDSTFEEFKDRNLSDVIGQAMADRVMNEAPNRGLDLVIEEQDFVIGGEAMKSFYDKMVPSIANKVLKKLDKSAKVELFAGTVYEDIDHPWTIQEVEDTRTEPPSVKWQINDSRGMSVQVYESETRAKQHVAALEQRYGRKVHRIKITDKMKEKVLEGQTLYQQKRGSITFDEARRATIRLYEARDLSTFLHEAGHLYLEALASLADRPDAPQQIRDDMMTIYEWLGVEDRSEITREHHEKWAESFEAYLMEGKAPSLALQDAFSAFKTWLTNIYRRIRGLERANLTDDIRGVMDRILASDEEITLAQQAQEIVPLFTSVENSGLSKEAFEVYRKEIERAHGNAVDELTQKMLRQMTQQQKQWYRDEMKRVQAEVEEEAHKMRVFKTLSALQKHQRPDGEALPGDPIKISKRSLIDLTDGDTKILRKLPRPYVYTVEGGVDVAIVANMFGYRSAIEMLNELAQAPKMANYVRYETKRRMSERYPDPQTDGSLAADAVAAVHNQNRSKVLQAEMRALRNLIRRDRKIVDATRRADRREDREAQRANQGQIPKRDELRAIKAAAKKAIGQMKVRDVRPEMYLRAERKFAKQAFEAMGKKDYQTAYDAKRKEMLNHEMYRAARDAQVRSDRARRYLQKFDSPRVQKRLGRSPVFEKILAVLEGSNFRKISLAQVDREKAVDEMLAMIEEGQLVVPGDMARKLRANGLNYQDMTIEELEGLRDLVKQLEHDAANESKAIVNGIETDIDEAADEVAETLLSNNKQVLSGYSDQSGKERLSELVDTGLFAWLRPSSLARVLDQGEFGALTRRIIVPIRRAYSEKLLPMMTKYQQDVSDLYTKHYSRKELSSMGKRNIEVKLIDESLSRKDIVAVAMHWGNESNRNSLINGVGSQGRQKYSEPVVRERLSKMTARDWRFVQDVWDYYDMYWPQIAEAEKRRRGIAPKKVEPDQFTIRTADGEVVTMRGGYAPIFYDPKESDRVAKRDEAQILKELQNGAYITASTRAGATYNRVENQHVVLPRLSDIDRHMREIIRDIALGDEVIYLRKLLDRKQVRRAFRETDNSVSLKALEVWLADATVGELPAETSYEFLARWVRVGFTASKLAFNVTTILLQITGFSQSMASLGSVHFAKGLGHFMADPVKSWKDVMKMSAFMQARYGEAAAWNKDVQDSQALLASSLPTAFNKTRRKMSYLYFLGIQKVQQIVDVTTWYAAYDRAVKVEELGHDDAIAFADAQVEKAQTSGFFSDRSAIERGSLGKRKNRQSEFVRLWTVLISYMLAKGNIAYEKTKQTKFKDPKQAASWIADMTLLFAVEGMLSSLIYGSMPDEDDEESLAWWAAKETGMSVLAGIPIVREVGASRYGGGTTPLGSLSTDTYRFIEQSMQGEVDEAWRKSFINLLGTTAHLPSSQVNRVIDALEEEDAEVYEYILGVRDED